jgi:hypothetical protein
MFDFVSDGFSIHVSTSLFSYLIVEDSGTFQYKLTKKASILPRQYMTAGYAIIRTNLEVL